MSDRIGDHVWLNGVLVDRTDAVVSPFDRGFLFAHAAYEVTAVYGGKLVDEPGHVARMARTLAAIDIDPARVDLPGIHAELMKANGLTEGLIYVQVTAGDYGFRDFAGPDTFEPTVFAYVLHKSLIGDAARDGVAAISLPDMRWARRDLKTTQLLSQGLAYRRAKEQGAATAWMHEDGVITEAASANAWIVAADGALVTRDLSASILHGITRQAVLSQARASGIDVQERAFTLEEVRSAREAFSTSAGGLVLPVIKFDGRPIGDGRPGPVTRSVQRAYYAAMGVDLSKLAPWLG